MDQDHVRIIELWKEKYSNQLEKQETYKLNKQLIQMGNIFAPGQTYYYVLNLHNLELAYVSPAVIDVLGISVEEVTIDKIIATALLKETELVHQKEKVLSDFFSRFLPIEQRCNYKALYCYRMKDYNGTIKTMLHQAVMLSKDDKGNLQFGLSIHTDISHLKVPVMNRISFLSLEGGRSYLNVDSSKGVFTPVEVSDSQVVDLQVLLTKREIQVIEFISRGMTSKIIAEILNISPETIRTHRKNILRKTNFKSFTELIAQSILSGNSF